MTQHRQLGERFRQIYVYNMSFLPPSLSPMNENDGRQTLRAHSTDVWRTQQSAQSLLDGLYPAKFRLASQQAIPLHIKPTEVDTLQPNPSACPRLASAMTARYSTVEWISYHKQATVQSLQQRLNQICETSALSAWQVCLSTRASERKRKK
jgi:hypothetical protein